MPPLSYLIDWAWLRFYGPSELGFRLFHSLFVVAGATGLSIFVWRQLGPLAAIVILTFFVLSPKLIQVGTEIRAYPIFFAVSCAQAAVFVKLVADPHKPDIKWLAALVLACLAAIYTHFYGVVSTSAFFLVLGLVYIRSLAALARLVVAGGVVVVGSLGILPFVLAGVNRSAATAPDKSATGRHLIYFLKLFGNSANVVSVTAAILFFGGILALFCAGSIGIFGRLRHRRLMPIDWLLAVVIAGASATVAASLYRHKLQSVDGELQHLVVCADWRTDCRWQHVTHWISSLGQRRAICGNRHDGRLDRRRQQRCFSRMPACLRMDLIDLLVRCMIQRRARRRSCTRLEPIGSLAIFHLCSVTEMKSTNTVPSRATSCFGLSAATGCLELRAAQTML